MLKVSVIIPTYNREKYLSEAVGCLKNQTLEDIEFVIVDDGSTDNTKDVLSKEIAEDKRFKVISYEENRGPSYARNQALKVIQGEYVGFFDIDDHIPADYFEILYKVAKNDDADIVCAFAGKNPRNLKEKIDILRNGSIWDKIYKKELLDLNNLKFEEGLFTADTFFTAQAVYYASKLCLTSETKYNYKLHRDSIGYAKKNVAKRKDDLFEIIGKIKEFAREKGFDEKELSCLNAWMLRCFSAYPKDKNFQKKLSYVLGKRERCFPKKELFCLKIKKLFHIINTASYKEQRAIILFKNSPLFDREWYLLQYPEARASKMLPERHYYRTGWKLGFNPSLAFDGNAYLSEHTDVKSLGRNPLEHYLLAGQHEGRYFVAVGGAVGSCPVSDLVISHKNKTKTRLIDKIKYVLEYPIRVQEEYERLKAEIRELEKGIN